MERAGEIFFIFFLLLLTETKSGCIVSVYSNEVGKYVIPITNSLLLKSGENYGRNNRRDL